MHYVARLRNNIDKPLDFSYNPPVSFSPFFTCGRKVLFLHDFYHDNINPEHSANSFSLSPFYNKPTVFLIRDPRDVIVSHFHHIRTKFSKNKMKLIESVDQFVREPAFGIKILVDFYNLQAKYARQAGKTIFVKYEDLKRNHSSCLEEWNKMFSHLLERDIDQDALVWALDINDFKKMQQREMAFKNNSGKTTDDTGDHIHVRRGKIGTYKDEMEPETLGFINEYINEHLNNDLSFYKN